MREVRLVGPHSDGGALVVECEGEELRLVLDDRLRAVVDALDDASPAAPTTTVPSAAVLPGARGSRLGSLTPREIQRRVRAGEPAGAIAGAAGVPIDLVAAFEGPVLAERQHQADKARAVVVQGIPLGQRVEQWVARHRPGRPIVGWDSRLAADGQWRVRVDLTGGEWATWIYEPSVGRIESADARAAAMIDPTMPASDDVLEEVLRPVALRSAPPAPVVDLDIDPDAQPDETDPETVDVPSVAPLQLRPRHGRRASVPQWDEISARSARHAHEDPLGS
ncbi:MAG TPA: septation protein SepH [Mycobacteriales bacterium]|nr:septation protein SepH [Mycobacteriales bacterium]